MRRLSESILVPRTCAVSLMNVYRHLGRPADVVATYDHCRKALAGHLGTLPSAQTETLLERARASSIPNSNPRV